jgi:Ca2+/Na+ antiporter
MLAKMLTGAYVAFLISCLVFFVSSENQDSRFGLCVGGLFAAIGNKYIVESAIPGSTSNTLMDDVHNLTFTFILLIVGIIIFSLNMFESGDEIKKKKSLKLDRWAFVSVISLYMLINAFFIWCSAS